MDIWRGMESKKSKKKVFELIIYEFEIGWIRRDILLDVSFPIPVGNIGGFFDDLWMTRVPTEQEGRVEDWVSPLELLEGVAEGITWSETETGIRLATSMLRGGERVLQALKKAEFEKDNDLTLYVVAE